MERMLDYEKIGLFLSNERKKEKLTQKQLAEKLNITFQAVSRWEKGISIPSLDVLDDLSHIFSVSIDEILKGERFNKHFSYEKAGVDVKKVDIINKKSC
jgi:phosphoribosylformylglycinamidine cyclo-ligase